MSKITDTQITINHPGGVTTVPAGAVTIPAAVAPSPSGKAATTAQPKTVSIGSTRISTVA